MSVENPNDVAENEAVAAKLRDMDARAIQQPCTYRTLFDGARELAEEQFKRAMAAEARLFVSRTVMNAQAEDEALWCQPHYASEAHMQAALRRLHEAVEGKTSEQCARSALD